MDFIETIDQIGHKYPFVMLGAVVAYNSAVQALPTPTDQSWTAYRWLFNFAHLLAANFGLVGKVRAN